MTIATIKRIKRFLNYCITTFIVFSLSLLLMISYEFYVKIVNDNLNSHKKSDRIQQSMNAEEKQNNIERVDHVKVGYKDAADKDPHIFVIDVLKIGKCRYILVHSHIDGFTDIELVHANDCEECIINEKNYYEISKQLLDLIARKEIKKHKENKE